MVYEPLHHKYRPQTFAQLVGQESIVTTLTNALRERRIAPAYLFTGARGTGKTSSARILAKSLNCLASGVPTDEPCGMCDACRSIAKGFALDVIEIDAASNTGVDNIRDLIERAQFAPVQCRYKVYVVDECHMLSNQAFNALLKTLEEPPDRVVFVLATTDPQRVLPTIISRCQRFDFRRIPLEAMVQHLSTIASKEAINISSEAIQLVAQISQGGLRDAESLLDQLSLLKDEVTAERVWDLVGAVPERNLLTLLLAIISSDPITVLDQARHLMDRGREPLIVLQNLTSFYRDLLVAKTAPDRADLVALTAATWTKLCELAQRIDLAAILMAQQHLRTCEVQVKHSTQPRLWLEVTLLGLLSLDFKAPAIGIGGVGEKKSLGAGEYRVEPTLSQPVKPPAPAEKRVPVQTPAPVLEAIEPEQSPEYPLSSPEAPPVPREMPVQVTPGSSQPSDLQHTWQQVVAQIQPYSTQVMVRQQCRLLDLNERDALVGVSSQPLLKMAQRHLPNIEAAFQQVFDRKLKINLQVASVAEVSPVAEAPPTPEIAPAKPVQQRSASFQNTAPASTPPPVSQPPSDPPALQTSTWEDEDEVTKASRNLAQFFNGTIVDLDEDQAQQLEPEHQELPGAEVLPSKNWEENDPDIYEDDVPF